LVILVIGHGGHDGGARIAAGDVAGIKGRDGAVDGGTGQVGSMGTGRGMFRELELVRVIGELVDWRAFNWRRVGSNGSRLSMFRELELIRVWERVVAGGQGSSRVDSSGFGAERDILMMLLDRARGSRRGSRNGSRRGRNLGSSRGPRGGNNSRDLSTIRTWPGLLTLRTRSIGELLGHTVVVPLSRRGALGLRVDRGVRTAWRRGTRQVRSTSGLEIAHVALAGGGGQLRLKLEVADMRVPVMASTEAADEFKAPNLVDRHDDTNEEKDDTKNGGSDDGQGQVNGLALLRLVNVAHGLRWLRRGDGVGHVDDGGSGGEV
jgi:hypothetical protein